VLASAAAIEINLAAFAKDIAICNGRRAACGIYIILQPRTFSGLPLQLWWHACRVHTDARIASGVTP
jgi:hypothetical protein